MILGTFLTYVKILYLFLSTALAFVVAIFVLVPKKERPLSYPNGENLAPSPLVSDKSTILVESVGSCELFVAKVPDPSI